MESVWFCLLGWMVATYTVLGGSDLGVGMIHKLVARTDDERWQVIRSIRPVWKPNEVWLVAAGGTLFLAFPRVLAVSLSGFYLAMMLVLWLIALRGLAIELRYHVSDRLWTQLWDTVLPAASLLLVLCLGAALGNVVRGVPLDADGVFFEPLWTDFGLGAQTGILDWYTVLVGLTAVAALAHHGALWLVATTDGDVRTRAQRLAGRLWPVTAGLLVLVSVASLAALAPVRESVVARPWGLVFPLLAATGLTGAMVYRRAGRGHRAFLCSALTLYAMLATAADAVFPHILPARDPALGLLARDAAAPYSGLALALIWWIPGMLLVCAYFAFIYTRMPRVATLRDHE